MNITNSVAAFLVSLAGVVFLCTSADADMKQMKAYKEAFPGAKVKCIDCHKDALPKKDAGMHELNEYATAVADEAKKAAEEAAAKEAAEPTVDSYKKVGAIENFKK